MKRYAIIVAGGTGSRMKGDVPKQFMLLDRTPIIQYSIEAFHEFDPEMVIILAIHSEYIEMWEKLIVRYAIDIPCTIVKGGETRFDSVKNGLELITNTGFVAVHDAARPLVTLEFIAKQYAEAEQYGSALPGTLVTDTIRMIDGASSKQLDRTRLLAIQTPQVFKTDELIQAYTQEYNSIFTDDASVMEAAGYSLHITEGLKANFKITHPEDIAIAEVLLQNL